MLIILNHKMNLTRKEAVQYAEEMQNLLLKEDQLVICPSYTNLAYFQPVGYALGSQDVSGYPNGAHTGNISASQLASFDVTYTIVGHSERRINEQESDHLIHLKMEELLGHGITPVLCVGETEVEKENGETLFKVMRQIEEALRGFQREDISKIVIAYEPIWAIGSGRVPQLEQIDHVVKKIKEQIDTTWQLEVPILYGGSINQSNIESLRTISSLSGFLIGGFGLDTTKIRSALK